MHSIFLKVITLLSGVTLLTYGLFAVEQRGPLVVLHPVEIMRSPTTTVVRTPLPAPTLPPKAPTAPPIKPTPAKPKPVVVAPPAPKPPATAPKPAPTPLPTPPAVISSARITAAGILEATNAERVNISAVPLTASAILNKVATERMDDLFANQYFSHDAPDGTTYVDTIERNGYLYSLIGENLAMGDYSTSASIVTAWMNSPGHRANMLKSNYTEIGIAVAKRHFEDRDQWIAVQIFGKPR